MTPRTTTFSLTEVETAALGVGQQQDVLFSPNTANVGGMVPRAAAVARS